MKAEVDKDGFLKIDVSSFVEAMPETALRELARAAMFRDDLISAVVDLVVEGTCWDDDSAGASGMGWWFSGETINAIRMRLMPLVGEATREAVIWLDYERKRHQANADRYRDLCWKLTRSWHNERDALKAVEAGRESYFPKVERLNQVEAEALLRATEAELGAKPRCAKCASELGKSYHSDVPGVGGDLCPRCHAEWSRPPRDLVTGFAVNELPPGGVADVKDPTGCMATETTIDTRCRWHSRAYGGRCDLAFGHGGLCSTAGDEFAGGWEPGMP